MGKFLIFLVLIVGVILGIVYFMPKKTEKSAVVEQTSAAIQLKDFKYSPEVVKVKAGEKVTFTNMDISGHSVTADDGSFDTGFVSQNESAVFTAPSKPGTYKFHCTPHPSITGTLIVE